jgi:hypothetical protein
MYRDWELSREAEGLIPVASFRKLFKTIRSVFVELTNTERLFLFFETFAKHIFVSFRGAKRREIFLLYYYFIRFLPAVEMTN